MLTEMQSLFGFKDSAKTLLDFLEHQNVEQASGRVNSKELRTASYLRHDGKREQGFRVWKLCEDL